MDGTAKISILKAGSTHEVVKCPCGALFLLSVPSDEDLNQKKNDLYNQLRKEHESKTSHQESFQL